MKGKTTVLLMAFLLTCATALAQAPPNPPDQPAPPPTQPAQPAQPAPAQGDQPAPQGQQQGQPEGQQAQPAQAQPAQAAPPDPVLEAAKDAFKKGDYQAALEGSKKVLEGKPEDLEALYIAGVSTLRLGQYDDAETYLNKLVQLEPRMPNIFFHLGHLAFARGDDMAKEGRADEAKAKYAEAAQKFAQEIERTPPTDPPPIQALQSRALALARAGQYDDSFKAYEAWITAAPKNARAYLALGSLYAELGRATDAMAILDRLPMDNAKLAADGSFAIARSLYAKEKYAETLTFIQKMQAMSLESRALHGLLSATYARLGNLQSSAQELCQFMSQKPPTEESSSLGEVIKMTFGGDWAEEKAPKQLPKGALPELDRQSSPRYPPEARKDRIETQIMLMALVNTDGAVAETCTVPSGVLDQLRQYGLEQSAIECVKKWKFLPARKDGTPVAAYYPAVVTFALR